MATEIPKDEQGREMFSDEERVAHGFAPIKDDTDPRGREEREAAARGEEFPPEARASRRGLTAEQAGDEPVYSDAIEAEAYTRLRAGLPMTKAQVENREIGERQREARAQEAAAEKPEPSPPPDETAPAEEQPPESPPAQPAPVTQGQPAGGARPPRSGPPPPTQPPPPHPPAP